MRSAVLLALALWSCWAIPRPQSGPFSEWCRDLVIGEPMTRALVEEAHRARPDVDAEDFRDGVPTEPSAMYSRLAKRSARISDAGAHGCSVHHATVFASTGTSFDDEWDYLRRREAARASALAELNEQAEIANAAFVQARAALVAKLSRLGYAGVLFDVGLAGAIEDVVAGRTKIEELKGVAIEVSEDGDGEFLVSQDLGHGSALYSDGRRVLLMQGLDEIAIEGSPLSALSTKLFKIDGVTRYATIAGSRQAFVVTPIRITE